ncbi:MAG: class I SAM-dependent RNA methyltransferase [Lachnospiraceae bacterium]|nr:class I SAM-dependent RNA methyltransferase [Lachnospiraceae bacterium]
MKKGVEYIGKVEATEFPCTGVLHCEGEKVRVKGAVEGQTVRFAMGRKHTGYISGKLHEIIERSPLETKKPVCLHFERCGGCTYQRFEYKDELALKKDQVRKLLDDVIKDDYDFTGIEQSPMEWGYRNKMEFTFGDCAKGGELTLGLHKKGSFYDIEQITDCHIVHQDYNKIIDTVVSTCREFGLTYMHKLTHEGYLRHLLIRRAATTGEILVCLVTTSDWKCEPVSKDSELTDEILSLPIFEDEDERPVYRAGCLDITEQMFLEVLAKRLRALILDGSIVGISRALNDDPADAIKAQSMLDVFGKNFFFEEILGLIFKITAFSFFQTNSFGAEVLYKIARDFLGDVTGKVVYDLYSGTGTIAQIIAPVAKKVIGVEIVEEAVAAARENVELNDLKNCEFICGDVLKVLDSIEEAPGAIILDPPREGIHPKALKRIISYGVDKIIYISCKPTSLAHDLVDFIDGGYRVEKVRCCDMFPHTVHVETVCLLSNRKPDARVKIDVDLEDYYRIKDEQKKNKASE